MRLAIIGAGAMGSLFGGRLTLAGEEVWLLDTREDQINAICKNGLVICSDAGDSVVWPKATTNPYEIGLVDLVIIFVKSIDTCLAARTAQHLLKSDTAVLTLQNGYGNAEKLAAVLGREKIIVGTTAQGAMLLKPGRVMHSGTGDTHVGNLSGESTPCLWRLAAMLFQAGFPTYVDEDVTALIWGKLVINVGINALTAITGLQNGRLADYEETKILVDKTVMEAVNVAEALGVRLPYPEPVAKVLAVARATAANRSSMLQDLTYQRLTEIDDINGAIVREGAKLGIDTQANYILTLLVKTFEKMNRENHQ